MAIFRAGKRIGPFDIRGGISRGDFKSSAYHKTDRDPRFKMQANPDNTIGRFRAAMASAEGYARPARYAIRLFPPTSLYRLIKQQNAELGSRKRKNGVRINDPSLSYDMIQKITGQFAFYLKENPSKANDAMNIFNEVFQLDLQNHE